MAEMMEPPGPWPSHLNKVLLIGTGAVAVSLLPGWVSLLRAWYNVEIKVVLSYTAARMVSPAVLSAVSSNEVHYPGRQVDAVGVEHRALSEWPDLVIVAPATAHYITRLAQGCLADSALYIPVLTEAPVVVAPSLPERVCTYPPVRTAIAEMQEFGFHVAKSPGPAISVHNSTIETGGLLNIVELISFVYMRFGDGG